VELDPTVFLLVKYLHVLLFVYWLGGDLGVWWCGKHLIRDDLSLEERLRTREIGVIIDMAPRTCGVLMIPVGFTLSANWGSPLPGAAIAFLWVFGAAWLWLVWQVHWKKNEPIGKTMQKIDINIRYVVGAIVLGFGVYCLATGDPIAETWLAAKIALFGLILFNGIVLRKIAAQLLAAFPMVRAGGEQRAAGEVLIKKYRRTVEPPVLTIWALVAIMGFLGVVKPF
jgi:uncharacterized membrane protein